MQDVPAEFLAKERELEMQKEDILAKPEAIRQKIVQGRLDKMCNVQSLTSQPYIKDDSQTISEVLKQVITATGENVKIRRCAPSLARLTTALSIAAQSLTSHSYTACLLNCVQQHTAMRLFDCSTALLHRTLHSTPGC